MLPERIITVTGFQPTNYPKTSFDGDSVSRYSPAHVWRPSARRCAARPRPGLSIRPRRLLRRGRLGPPGGRAPPGAGARSHAGGGGPERLLPDGPVGDGARGGAALRCPAGRARHARARGSRLSRESDESVLLLQDGVVAAARSGGAGPRARRRVRRHERGRPARASPRIRRPAGGGRALAPRP